MDVVISKHKHELKKMPFAEQFLLWALREWVYAYIGKYDRHELLSEGFGHLELDDSYLALDEFLGILSTSSMHKIEVRCPKCPSVSLDEQLIVGMFAAHQRSDHDLCVETFEGWLPPAAARIARNLASSIAMDMKHQGLILRRRQICDSDKMPASPDIALRSNTHLENRTVH